MRSINQDLLQRENAHGRDREFSTASFALHLRLPAEPAQDLILKVEGVRVHVNGIVEPQGGIDHAQDPAQDQARNWKVAVAGHHEELHEADELHRIRDRLLQLLGSFGDATVFQSCKGCIIQLRQN